MKPITEVGRKTILAKGQGKDTYSKVSSPNFPSSSYSPGFILLNGPGARLLGTTNSEGNIFYSI